jgi:hypothetical protein
MKNDQRYNEWSNFIEQYNEYFDVWNTNFDKLKEFIDTNMKTPSVISKNKYEKILASWLYTQNQNYKNRTYGMKNDQRYNEWSNFIEQYNEYFDVWNTSFDKLKEFIDKNNKTPSSMSKNKDEKVLGQWISDQNKNYKNIIHSMKYDERYNAWSRFLEQYKEYFVSNDDVWNTNFNKLKEFIDTNKKTPSGKSKNKDETVLVQWLRTQNRNYKNIIHSMKNDERYNAWSNFIEQYNKYFIDIDDVWNTNFDMLKEFIHTNNKTPSTKLKSDYEKALGIWLCTQNHNYKNRTDGMKDDERYNVWSSFIEQYNKYFDVWKSMELVKPIQQPKTEETPENKRIRTKSQMEILHKRYKNLNKEFKENTQLWNEYHEISEKNEESFPENEIPRNKIIQELDKLVIKRKRTVVDMGCGKGQISKYFTDKNDKRFQFINYDHISSDNSVISCDISNVPLEDGNADMVILSLAMWGSNCKSYIAEANRILDLDGKLYIIEATKRWSDKDENHNLIQGEEGGKLKQLLVENNFQILESEIKKFSMFTCRKIN